MSKLHSHAPRLSKLDRDFLAWRSSNKRVTLTLIDGIFDLFQKSIHKRKTYSPASMRGILRLSDRMMAVAGAFLGVHPSEANEKAKDFFNNLCANRDWCEFVHWACNIWCIGDETVRLTPAEICQIYWRCQLEG